MKSLRGKLFLSVGSVFLVVAFLNYLIPEIWVRKELNKAATYLNEYVEKVQENLRQFASFLVVYNLVEGAAELDGIAKILLQQTEKIEAESNARLAWQIAAFNSQIAFVQLSTSLQTVSLASEGAPLYSPLWAPFEQGMLWLKIPQQETLFLALPLSSQNGMISYLLFDEKTLRVPMHETLEPPLREKLTFAAHSLNRANSASFNGFKNAEPVLSSQGSPEMLFQALLWEENQWLEKMDLIKTLIEEEEKRFPISIAGVFKVDASFRQGVCLLKEEVFPRLPIIPSMERGDADLPFLLIREGKEGKDLDMAKTFPLLNREKWGGVGFSISTTAKKIAQMIQKTVVLKWEDHLLGFNEKGDQFDPHALNFPSNALDQQQLTWEGMTYYPRRINLKALDLIILTPEAQATALTQFLAELKSGISQKISLSLVGAALFSLGVALLLLEVISKKITKPIVLLSKAAEELGAGKYERVVLPELGKRRDEVAVLTHSFKNMLIALQDRDKIRGVLNKVVSKEICEEILKSSIELGGEERTLTILFSDIRGFTHFSETLPPKAIIGMLNAYMTRMCHIIDETHGVVDKFIGDAIMALYGAPLALEHHAVKAVEAALKMMHHLKQWNEERIKEREPVFEMGIGIHTGVVCAGNMGSENRLNYTVIGANVNLASRLCSQALPMQILISEATWNIPEIQERFRFKKLSPVVLKGIDHPVQVYEVVQE